MRITSFFVLVVVWTLASYAQEITGDINPATVDESQSDVASPYVKIPAIDSLISIDYEGQTVLDTVRGTTQYKAAPSGAVFSVDIVVPEDVTPFNIHSMEFTLTFDAGLLSLRTVAPGNVIPRGHLLEFGGNSDRVFVAAAGTNAYVGKGILARMEFQVSPAAQEGQTCRLHYRKFQFNEPPLVGPVAVIEDGFFLVGNFPDIELSETEHDFGETIVGDSAYWTLTVTNIGWDDLTVVSITGSGSEFGIDTPTLPQTVIPASSIDVDIYFTPEQVGLRVGDLTVLCNAYFDNELNISLRGTGIAPDITLSAREHDFGEVAVGNSADWTLRVSNIGNAPSTLSSFVIYPAAFDVLSPVFPQTVAVGEMADVMIQFAPVVVGQVSGVLSLYSNDPDENPVSIFLSGMGTPSLGVEDEGGPGYGPLTYNLFQNYPNPFNPSTSIQYSVADEQVSAYVNLSIYNLLGQKMTSLVDEPNAAGYYTVTWDGRDDMGTSVAAGVYLYRLQIGTYVQTRRMMLTK